ncbi:uncharacterized protein LOC120290506 [Eucalyptus grandis]|uniref:uncharacterized protein LOC120290506 n=1 Tax=Eucalyptus grandis TaxID=71139 RepID=UPI00192EC141|nr:uncharacterized protein LOC120290506 [Eucalyptus grandis]
MAILTTLSFSELPSPKIPPFSSISRSPALLISSRIRRNSSNLVARHRRRARRKNPPEQPRPPPGNDMFTAVQMPAAPRRWDEDHDRLLNSMGAGNGDTLTANNDRETSTSTKNVLRKEKSYTSSISFLGSTCPQTMLQLRWSILFKVSWAFQEHAICMFQQSEDRNSVTFSSDSCYASVLSLILEKILLYLFFISGGIIHELDGRCCDSVPLSGYRRSLLGSSGSTFIELTMVT